MDFIWNNSSALYIIGTLMYFPGCLIGFILMKEAEESNGRASIKKILAFTLAFLGTMFVGFMCLVRAVNLDPSSDIHAIMDVLGIILLR